MGYKVDIAKSGLHIKKAIIKLVADKKIVQAKGTGANGRFKAAQAEKPKVEKVVEKKPVAKKAKKPAAKKAKTPKKAAKPAAKKAKSPRKAAAPAKKAAAKPAAKKSPKKAAKKAAPK